MVEMVGFLPRLSSSRSFLRRSLSMTDLTEQDAEVATSNITPDAHGIEDVAEFKAIEHPVEPLNIDEPVKCPLPEPSILNDGRIWKELRSSASLRMRNDLPIVDKGSQLESVVAVETKKAGEAKPPLTPRKHAMLPSLSAPEHHLLNLLEECNFSGDQIIDKLT